MSARRWLTLAVLAAALLPLIFRGPDLQADATHALAILLGAVALNIAMGYAGQPSLAHGAFMGIGAFTYAMLRARAGWGPVAAAALAVVASAAAGWIVARGVSRLRSPFVALSTWLVAWAFWLALGSFSTLTGGTSGVIVAPARIDMRALGLAFTAGPLLLYEVALGAVVAALLAATSLLRRYGPALAAQREDPAAARAAGIDPAGMRTAAMTATAALAGVAGMLVAQVAGVADPTTFRPVLSIELFLAVLLGGAARMAGPAAGLVAIFAVTGATGALSRALGVSAARLEPLTAAVVLGLVLLVGRDGIVSLIERIFPPADAPPATAGTGGEQHWLPGARIEARDIHVSFGGIRALDGVTFAVDAGTCHALIGPNGCGKTTMLKVLSGSLVPNTGTVLLDGSVVDTLPARRRVEAGIVRTLQRVALPARMTAADHVRSGMHGTTGFVQALTRTPNARAEERSEAARARAILDSLDLGGIAALKTDRLGFGERRLVQLARALAPLPRVLLLDEPSAGLDERETNLLVQALERVRRAGTTIVLVAHDVRLVRRIADRVTVLDAGAVIAEGSPADIANDIRVRTVYMGE